MAYQGPRPPRMLRACNLCGKVVPMTRYQRFCSRCKRRATHIYVPTQGRLIHALMQSIGQPSGKDGLLWTWRG